MPWRVRLHLYIVSVMEGRAGGPAAWLLRCVLACGVPMYWVGLSLSRRMTRPQRLSCPVISVGNLTVGGTGKTPVVAWLAKRLERQGRRVAILTRGYHRALGATGLVDTDGVGLYITPEEQPSLPVVNGISLGPKLVLGAPIMSRSLRGIVHILNQFKLHPRTAQLRITTVDAANPSKIELTLNGGLRVILDQDSFPLKVQNFDTLLAQKKVDWAQAQYVDLRFNEPIIAKPDDGKEK